MTIWGTFLSAFIISLSGAMMPGPMLGVTIEGSVRQGFKAGPLLVLGHGLVEILLIALISVGLKNVITVPEVSGAIGILGGVYLAWMGYGMIKSGISNTVSLEDYQGNQVKMRNLVLTGVLVSIFNPYFIIWWATTGMELIRQSLLLGFIGLGWFYLGHIIADLAWYSGLSYAFSRGKNIISPKLYRGVIFCLGIFLLCFALYFLYSGSLLITTALFTKN